MTTLMVAVFILAALISTLTAIVKDALGTDGKSTLAWALFLGAVLGAVLALGGLDELHVLPRLHDWQSGAVVGLLSGFFAAGGRKYMLDYENRKAAAKAQAEAQFSGWQPLGELDQP